MVIDFQKSKRLQSFIKKIKENNSLVVDQVSTAVKAFLISLIVDKNILIVTRQEKEDKLFDCLQFFLPTAPLELPSWETLPEEDIDPSPDIIGKRLETLEKIIEHKKQHVVVCPYSSLLQKLPEKALLKKLFQYWKIGSDIVFDELSELLTGLGYRQEALVTDKGQFALRGGILDIFANHSYDPYRIEFFGNTIDSIRTFDPVGQKSLNKINEVLICPASEKKLLDLSKPVSIIDYLGNDTVIVFEDLLKIEDSYVSLKKILEGKLQKTFSLQDVLAQVSSFQKLFFSKAPLEDLTNVDTNSSDHMYQDVTFEMFDQSLYAQRFTHPFQNIYDFFDSSNSTDIADLLNKHEDSSTKIHFIVSNEKEQQIIEEKVATTTFLKKYHQGYLPEGFVILDDNLAIIPFTEFSKRARIRRQKWRSTYHIPAAEFHELSPGDLVVHFHSGIGKYLGIEKQTGIDGNPTEYMAIAFAENSKLLVPLSQSHLVSRYIGSQESPPTLHKLGTKRWQTTKLNAQKQILGYASDLLNLHAEREYSGGFAYPHDSEAMVQFEEEFPYVETPDQLNAILEIKSDMRSEKAMDRLLCGDVGYGKTEVAMRAAFKAVVDGQKQVAVLVPTTVLAAQHFENFSTRMQGYPINIDMLSRFKTAKQTKEVLEKAKQGSLDIVIGTHRILSKDISFKNLGLIIIDEEQRFGVRAKEHLKKMKQSVDCLTLSATPIPRTLYMSLITIRDMSVINSPPQDRLPVKSIITETEDSIIKNALQRELAREGQAFFIHNRVETIFKWSEKIKKLVPNAKVGVVHGQMSSDEIDNIFHKFKEGLIQILVATTIVESGIDIPNANTILIDRADTYGLSDLYQLRGRVGRWNRSAFAYFLVPKNRVLPEISRKRLNALLEAGGYGGGMKIAMRDLEIRGAGDILGVQQSGQVSSIGFHLYCKLLKKAVQALKNKTPVHFTETKIEFPFDAQIPSSYIPESKLRMELYHRLGEAVNFKMLDDLLEEIKDRFGKPPEEVIWLYHLSKIKVFSSSNKFTLLKLGKRTLIAEQKVGKKDLKKTLLLSVSLKEPEKVEKEIINLLQKNFICESVH
ncbi:MAG: transcription-repair coupling factor [Chlamydiae bacterium CG10_big_fil_rev_8_21_14_0_10_35_9]|nr:MAG: transcription-repair coupling factor [Chlamydiae bacterium CG10_big_fil_rev_8_21_14_0_10_35_9]